MQRFDAGVLLKLNCREGTIGRPEGGFGFEHAVERLFADAARGLKTGDRHGVGAVMAAAFLNHDRLNPADLAEQVAASKSDRLCAQVARGVIGNGPPRGTFKVWIKTSFLPDAPKKLTGIHGRFGDLLRKIPGVKPVIVQECCGHNGTFAMTVDGFEPSRRIGKKAFDAMLETKSSFWSTDCPLAAIQFEQHTGVKPMHPMSILARAYREDGFDKKVE